LKNSTIIIDNLDATFEEIKFLLARRLTIVFTIVFSLLVIAHRDSTTLNLLVMTLGLFISLSLFIYNQLTKNYTLVYTIFSITGVCVVSTVITFLPSATHYADMLWIFTSLVLAFFGVGNKLGFILLAIAIIGILTFVCFGVNENILTLQPRTDFQKFSLAVEIIAVVTSGIYIIFLINQFYSLTQSKLIETNEALKIQNEKIKVQDEEKTVLVKEIHHRVKNNLQIVTSLLRMQSAELVSEESKIHFQEAINRVMSMSLIHQKLYQGESLSRVNLQEYIEELVIELISIYNIPKEISYSVKIEQITVGLSSIVPLGLMINELTSNSLKHAFSDLKEGQISINLIGSETDILIYKDSGKWKENSSRGFGLDLIDLLSEQLDGTYIHTIGDIENIYEFNFIKLTK
jgi:two-component sensor histidine kinase